MFDVYYDDLLWVILGDWQGQCFGLDQLVYCSMYLLVIVVYGIDGWLVVMYVVQVVLVYFIDIDGEY